MKVVFLYFLFAFVEMSELSAQLSGIYTVGSKHHISDFKSLQEVFDTLEKSGVSGPVTIKMLPETYQGLFSLGYVPGANDLNRIIIESYSGDSSSVILTSNGTSNGGTVSLWGAAFVTIRNITVQNLNSISYLKDWAIDIRDPYSVSVEHCQIISTHDSGGDKEYNSALHVSGSAYANDPNCKVSYCTIISNRYGVYVQNTDISISDCRVINKAEISITASGNPVRIKQCETSNAIFSDNTSGHIYLTQNKIHGYLDLVGHCHLEGDLVGDSMSINNDLGYVSADIYQCNFYNTISHLPPNSTIDECYLENLYLAGGGEGLDATGNIIEQATLYNQSSLHFYRNHVWGDFNLSSSDWEDAAFVNNMVDGDANFITFNNTIAYNNFNGAFSCTEFNHVYNNNFTIDFPYVTLGDYVRDYNNYYPGINTSELHAFHIDPMYVSSSDLHIQNTALKGLDTLLLTVDDDFDGDKREGHSAIGADAICFPDSFTPMEDITVTCGDSVYLTPVSCSGATFQWIAVSSGDTLHIADPLVNPYQSDTYLMNAGDECGHLHVDTVQVSIIPFQIQASYSPPAYCGIAELLTSSYLPSYTYHWEPVNYVSAPASYITYAAASDTVVYKVTAENSMCGVSEDSLTVPITNTVSASFNVDVYSNAALFHNTSTFPAWYVWDFGDGTQSLELNPTHYYSQYTWYYVTLTVTNSCGESDTVSEWVNYNSGIAEEGTDSRISISGNPNPFIDQLALIIKNDEQCDGTVRLLTMYGQEVHVFTIESMKEQRFDIAAYNLESGVYVVLLKLNDGKSLLKRIVKQ